MADLFDGPPDFDPPPTPSSTPARRKRVTPIAPPVEEFVVKPREELEPGVMPSGKGWRRNEGKKPGIRAKRVVVKLRSGRISGAEPLTSATPAGWLVETTRWTLTGEPFDVEFFKPL